MFRRTRVALAAFLSLAVVTFGVGQESASAATSSYVGFTVHVDTANVGYGDSDFGASVSLDSDGTIHVINAWCFGSMDRSPFFAQWCEEGAESTFSLYVLGAGCDPQTGLPPTTWDKGPGDGFRNVTGQKWMAGGGGGEGTFNPGAGCDPAQMCVAFVVDDPLPGEGSTALQCDTIVLEAAAPIPSGCPAFKPLSPPSLSQVPVNANTIRVFGATPIQALMDADGVWEIRYYFVWRQQSTGKVLLGWPLGGLAEPPGTGDQRYNYVSMANPSAGQTFDGSYSAGSVAEMKFIGVQYLTAWGFTGSEQFDRNLGGVTPGGDLGTTQPSKCFFYFGEKIASGAGSDPAGPTSGGPSGDPGDAPNTQPDQPTEEDDYYPDEDPATDPASWWKLLLAAILELGKMLGKLAMAVAGLVGALLEGLLELLSTLFIPDPSSWGSDGVMTQMEDSGPTNTIGEVSQGLGSTVTTFRSASDGCGSLANFNIGGGGELDSCDASAALGGLRALVSAALITFTGIGIVKMLGGVLER